MTIEKKTVKPADPTKFGLPCRAFLYTLDQIAVMLDVPISTFTTSYVFYIGRSTGRWNKHLMQARNIAPPGDKPEWRIAERELLKWLKLKGFKVYESDVVVN